MKKTWVNIPDVLFFQEGPGVRNTQYTKKGVKLLNVANLVDGKVDLSTSDRYISEEEAYGKYKHFLCDAGDLIVASSGIKVEYIDKKMGFIEKSMLPLCMNTSTIRFKVLDKNKLHIRYFMYYLKSQNFKGQLAREITGSAQLNYGPSHLKKMKMPLVDIAVQNEIVHQMDKVQKIIDMRHLELLHLDNLIKARFVEMFGDENNSKKWDVVHIEEVANVQVGVVIKPAQYYTDARDGVRAFRSLNIGEGFVKDSDWVYFTEEGHQKNARSILEENDLLVVRSGTPGTSCVVTKEYVGYNAIDIIIARPDCEKVNPHYLCTFTNLPHGKRQISEGIGGAAQQHFNVSKYNQLKLMLPPKKLQEEFADFVRQTDKSKSAKAMKEFNCHIIYYMLHFIQNNFNKNNLNEM